MYRKGTEKDCEAVYALICELECCTLPFDCFSEIYRQQIQDRHYYCLLCESGGVAAGVLNLRFEGQLHHAERVAEIMEFVVHAPCRNRGIGKELFARACRIAAEAGCSRIEVACNRRRGDAHRFYLREGMGNSHYRFSKPLKSGKDVHL